MDTAKVPQKDQNWNEIDLYLFSNGQQNSPPRKYHLCADELNWWEATLHFLARSHYGPLHSNIEIYTLSGKKIENPMELTNDTAYVAVEPPDPFIDAGYEKYLMKATKSWEKRQQKLIEAAELNNEGSLGPTSAKLEKTSTMQVVIEDTVKNIKIPEIEKNNRSSKTGSVSSVKIPTPSTNTKSYMRRITPTKPLLTSIMPRKSSLKKKDNIDDIKTNFLNFSSQDPLSTLAKNKTKNKFLTKKPNKIENNVESIVDNSSKRLSKEPVIHQIRTVEEEEKDSAPFLYKNPEPDFVSNVKMESKDDETPLNPRNSIRCEENINLTKDLLTTPNNVRAKRDFFERESINPHDYSPKSTNTHDKRISDINEEFQNVITQLSVLKNDYNDSIENDQFISQPHSELQPELQRQLETIVRHVVKTLFDMSPNNNITFNNNYDSPDTIQRNINDTEISERYPNGIVITDVNGEKIVTLVHKGDSVHLKLNIELKHVDEEKDEYAQQIVQSITKTDQQSQVNFNFALKQISSQQILSHSTEIFGYSKTACCEERTEYIIIQCDCAENTNFYNNSQSDDFSSKFMLLVPMDQRNAKSTSKIKAIKVDKKSLVSMQTEINPAGSAITIRKNKLEDDGSVTAKRSVVYNDEVLFDEQEYSNKNVEYSHKKKDSLKSPKLSREWPEVQQNTIQSERRQSFVDSSTQTSWCDIVIEARIKENGQCSLHLPPLHVIKQCDFVKE